LVLKSLSPQGQNASGEAESDKMVADPDQKQLEWDFFPYQFAGFKRHDECPKGYSAA